MKTMFKVFVVLFVLVCMMVSANGETIVQPYDVCCRDFMANHSDEFEQFINDKTKESDNVICVYRCKDCTWYYAWAYAAFCGDQDICDSFSYDLSEVDGAIASMAQMIEFESGDAVLHGRAWTDNEEYGTVDVFCFFQKIVI